MISFYSSQYNYMKTYMGMMNRMQPMQMNNQYPWMQQTQYPTLTPMNQNVAQSEKMLDALNSLSTNVSNLEDSSYSLMSDNQNATINLRTTSTTDQSAVTASAKKDASIEDYKIQINQVAKAQQNKGTELNQYDLTSAATGTNEFSLTVGGESRNLSVSILSTDTNEEAIQKVASAINDAELGVSAKTITDNNTGTVQIELSSTETGTDSSFSLSDVSGNIVSTIGADNVSTQAQNAEYYLNGNLETSQTNTILVDNEKVALELKEATAGEETISVKADTDQIIENVKTMVEDYNNLQRTFDYNADVLKSSVGQNFDRGLYSYQFNDTGISKSYSGSLRFNEDELKQQLTQDFDRTVNSLSNLSEQINEKADTLGQMTGEMLLDKSNQAIPTMNNYGMNTMYNNPFYFQQQQPYSWLTGMMFDQYY